MLGAILAVGVAARPADDDMSVIVFFASGAGQTTTTGLQFQITAEVEGTSGIARPVTLRIELPTGLRWGADAPDVSEGCSGDTLAVCTAPMVIDGAGTARAGWRWDVVAERPGAYAIAAMASSAEPDPNTANNSYTFRFDVLAAPGGVEGGGGSGGGAASAMASSAKVSPAKPKAGSAVSATMRVTAGRDPIRPSRIACAGAVGAAKVKGTARAVTGAATCTFRTPIAAKGTTLRGSVAFTARGERFRKRFSAKLG